VSQDLARAAVARERARDTAAGAARAIERCHNTCVTSEGALDHVSSRTRITSELDRAAICSGQA
jgi:hypothetical protein